MSSVEHIGGVIEPICGVSLHDPGVNLAALCGSLLDANLRIETITEQELVTEYTSDLEVAQEILATDTSRQVSEVRTLVDRYVRLSSYISCAAMNEAVEGLAVRQAAIIESTDSQLALMVAGAEDDCGTPDIHKSNGYIAQSLRQAILKAHPDMADKVYLADPLCPEQQARLKDPVTRICWVDDWIATGEQMNYNLVGRPFDPATKVADGMAEINLIAFRQDQLPYGFFDMRDEYATVPHKYEPPVIGYWVTPDIGMQRSGPMPFGFHSSCDWGFSDTLGKIGRVVQELSGRDFCPMAKRIVSPYRPRSLSGL